MSDTSKVTRLSPSNRVLYLMVEDERGQYVAYSDYDALLTTLTKVRDACLVDDPHGLTVETEVTISYELFAEMQDAIDKAEGMMEWQPIETAPKDGTRILAAHDRMPNNEITTPYEVFWGVGKLHDVRGLPGLYRVNDGKPCWLERKGVKMAPTPTHWKEKI